MSGLHRMGLLSHHFLLIAVIAALDIFVGEQVSLWVFFLIPIGLANWNLGRWAGVTLTVVCGSLTLLNGLVVGYPYASLGFYLLAVASKIVAMTIVVWLINLVRKREIERVYIRRAGQWPESST